MKGREFPYQKINFILSVIGFIGSIGFYYGVLRDLKQQAPDKQELARLKTEIEQLKIQLLHEQQKARQVQTQKSQTN